MQWTCRQEEIIREQCFRGAAAVRDAIERECGVSRSVHAVEAHASRIGVSLRRLEECPECHAVGVRINRQSGMCPLCTARAHVAEEEAFRDLLAMEAEGCEEGSELDEARRRYAALRQANSRTCRRHGLPGKRGRGDDGAPIARRDV